MAISVYSSRNIVENMACELGKSSREAIFAQIYQLYEVEHMKRSDIADHMGLSPATISSYRYKMKEELENIIALAEMLFVMCETVEAEEIPAEEVPCPVKVTYRRFKNGHPDVAMEFMPLAGENIINEQGYYFFKFYDADKLIFNKIGISRKDIIGRLRQEIGDYVNKNGYDVRRVEVHRMRSCGTFPAAGVESELRSKLVAMYPQAFRENDRFFDVDIDPEKFDEIVKNYLENVAHI